VGTTDSNHGTCLWPSGSSNWTASPVSTDNNTTPATTHLAQAVVTQDGSYPLLFLDTTGANAGAYSFTVNVLHAASVSFSPQSTIPGTGTFTASVLAPDSSPISDSTLKLKLNGYWRNRAGAPVRVHKLATAAPAGGTVTFDYSVPPSLWGKKIRLDITGGGASYRAVASLRESVKVLVPDPAGPVLVPASVLKTASKLLHQPIYWAGPRKGLHYEFWRLESGSIFVRYLPPGVRVGAPSSKFLIVGTYRIAHAFDAVKTFCGRGAVAGPHGSIYCPRPGAPKSVYVAFPKVDYEIEVYDPSPKVSRAIAAAGRVRPVR
jgi:hypothetical protein